MTVRPSPSDLFKSTSDLNKASVNFLKIDLETALTFAGIASQPTSDDKQGARNQHNARLGYDTVRRLLTKVSPSRADAQIIKEKLELLKSELIKLGERF